MISVLNHLQRLNGSKLIAALCIIVLLASCTGSKKTVQKTRTPNRKPKVEVRDTPVVIEEKEVIKEETPIQIDDAPVVAINDGLDAITKEEVYDMTFLAPFDGNRNLVDNANDRFLQYYAGMRMAADDLSQSGVNIRVNMVDTENRKINDVLNQEVLESTDVIMGPYDRNDLKYAIDYSIRHKVPLVSPWQSLNKLSKPSPYYVQLSPYLTEYYHGMLKHIADNYDAEDVFIVGRKTVKSDQKRIDGFQRLAAAYYKKSGSRPFTEIYADLADLSGEDPVFFDKLKENGDNVFIVPNWSGEDYDYVYNVMRRLSLEKADRNVITYGMFSVLDNPNITYELWRNLNLRVVANYIVDEESYGVKKFKRDFLNRYATLPTKDAYEGYDDFYFVAMSLHKYGKNFQFYLENETDPLIHTTFEIFRNMGDIESTDLEDIRFFENKHIDVVKMGEIGHERVK